MIRAMGHALLLFDPDFLLLVDDDTYVNMDFLRYDTGILSHFIMNNLNNVIVMGQLNGIILCSIFHNAFPK
jgi:hypothetical protein